MIKLKFNQSMIDEALNKSKQIGILKDSFRKGKGQQHGLLAEFAVKEYFKDLIKPTENFYNNRDVDVDNLIFGMKATLDGIVNAGLIPDDSPTYVKITGDFKKCKKGEQKTIVTISEINPKQ